MALIVFGISCDMLREKDARVVGRKTARVSLDDKGRRMILMQVEG